MKYKVISTDDHLQEAPHTWTARMSRAKWGDRIPHIERHEDGTEWWHLNDQPTQGGFSGRLGIVSGVLPDRAKFSPTKWEEMPEISYVPAERIKAMDQDGVDVHTFFGNISGIAGTTFSNPAFEGARGTIGANSGTVEDEEFRIECIRAFNDFQIEEYSDPYPGRFITLACLPMWSVDRAVEELWRTKKRGIRGISFAFPHQFGFPHIADEYWDPLWRAAQEAELPVNFHIGSGASMGMTADPVPGDPLYVLADRSTKSISANTLVMSTILFSRILERFPELKMVSAESGLGWVPYLLETADHQWQQQGLSRIGMPLKPSDYFHRQCYVNFWYEVTGIQLRHIIGVDNIMWESDFPHPTCTWPNSQDYIERGLKDVPDDERQRMLVGNALKLYHLDTTEG